MDKKIAILIIFFNKLSQTIECIESFLPSGENIYVLNNASEAVAWKMLQKKYTKKENILFFHSATNLGPARGRNLLIEKCTEEWIFLVDNDVRIRPEKSWKALFDKKVKVTKEAAIFCPQIFNVHENSFAKPHHFTLRKGIVLLEETTARVTNYFTCCGVIIHRKIFEAYGNFDEELFAFEDYEFSIRALCSSLDEFKVYQVPEIELIHDHQFQQKNKDKKAVLERYNEKKIEASMQRVMDKHGVIFEHHWQWWTKRQVAEMTGKTLLQKIKRGVTGLIGR